VDWVRFGRGIRALRIRRAWTQQELGVESGLSRSIVSRVERGRGDELTGRSLDRLALALGARAVLRLDWNGESLDRLLDSVHASLVDRVVAWLEPAGWAVVPEATFSIRGERGSVDVLAWHPAARAVLLVEVKSVVPDIQATLAPFDRKVRLAREIAALQGWQPQSIGQLLVIGDTRTSRRRVEEHRATFEARFPDGIAAVRRFIRDPGRAAPVRGVAFLPISTGARVRHRVARRTARRRAAAAAPTAPRSG
jgi:transcriptional regulator with XRE-family HTH domain